MTDNTSDDKKILKYLAKKLAEGEKLNTGESDLYANLSIANMRKKVESSEEGILEIAELFFKYIYENSEDYKDSSYYDAVATDGDVWLMCKLSVLFLDVWIFNNPNNTEEYFADFLDKKDDANDLAYEIICIVDECCRASVKIDERIHSFSVLEEDGSYIEVDMLLLAEIVELFHKHPGDVDYLRAVTETCFNKKYSLTSLS